MKYLVRRCFPEGISRQRGPGLAGIAYSGDPRGVDWNGGRY